VVVAIKSGGLTTVIVRTAVLVTLSESVTLTVKVKVPAAVGVPEINPPALRGLSPVGRAPETNAQVYGGAPPVAPSVALYAVPVVPFERVVVVIASGGITQVWSAGMYVI
jgi:hypothetical protein